MSRKRIRKKKAFSFVMIAATILLSGIFIVKEQRAFAGSSEVQYSGNSIEVFLKEKEMATEYNIEVENNNVLKGQTVQAYEELMKEPLIMIQNRGEKVTEDKIVRNNIKFKK